MTRVIGVREGAFDVLVMRGGRMMEVEVLFRGLWFGLRSRALLFAGCG